MSKTDGRGLHWVFKIADREKTIHFYRDVLGMTVLRHEEFDAGCEATCNGPYDNKWSKTMIGYGSEDTEFVFELTYNYGITGYTLGNDFVQATLELTADNLKQVRASGYKLDADQEGTIELAAPDGYRFVLREGPKNRCESAAIGVSNLASSAAYYTTLLGMNLVNQKAASARVSWSDVSGFSLDLLQSEKPIDHATAMGRLAFGYPEEKQQAVEDKVRASKQGTIINSLIKLDTPGKATVQVVILGDLDGHELAFVGEQNYRKLSVFDPQGEGLLNEAMSADGSRAYFEKKAKK